MGDGGARELRSWSIEPRDRRVHAVSPMHMHDGRLLTSLLHEAHNARSNSNEKISAQVCGDDLENLEDAKLQRMLSKYQSQVLQQQMSNHSNKEMMKTFANQSTTSGAHHAPPMSHSQPCLITISDQKSDLIPESTTSMYRVVQPFDMNGNSNLKAQLIASQSVVRALQDDSTKIKQQCDFLRMKANRLKQLESAYETIEKEYENLTAQKERQDNLERTARLKMEQQLARYASENELLRANIDQLIKRLQSEDQSERMNKLGVMLNELIPQNKELMECKSRQKMDIEALEVTLKDQRNHIQILEKALGNAQEKAWRKEKEAEELRANFERAEALQKAVEKSMFDKRIREDEWNRERAQLEMENAQLKMQLAKESVSVGMKKGANARSPDSDGEKVASKLKKALHSKEERIMQLEKNVIELEAKFHEEIQRNKMAIATQSDTLSGKLKKMEEEKSEKDRKIAELTEQKERLFEKLEVERKHSESRTNLLEREIDRMRTSDDRRFREDMARMEQMRLKIVDRRCCTTERTRNRCVQHGRTASGSNHTDFLQGHARASSASMLSAASNKPQCCSSSLDMPLDLSSGGGGGTQLSSDGQHQSLSPIVTPSSADDKEAIVEVQLSNGFCASMVSNGECLNKSRCPELAGRHSIACFNECNPTATLNVAGDQRSSNTILCGRSHEQIWDV